MLNKNVLNCNTCHELTFTLYEKTVWGGGDNILLTYKCAKGQCLMICFSSFCFCQSPAVKDAKVHSRGISCLLIKNNFVEEEMLTLEKSWHACTLASLGFNFDTVAWISPPAIIYSISAYGCEKIPAGSYQWSTEFSILSYPMAIGQPVTMEPKASPQCCLLLLGFSSLLTMIKIDWLTYYIYISPVAQKAQGG